ncbi:MAG: carotenoid oxygenase family protein [Rhodanobacteraceae bacterium]
MLATTPSPTNQDLPIYAELGRNTTDRADGELAVSGKLPADLAGVMYRNGPGLFHRGGSTRGTVLDGDGVVQRLALGDGTARYARRFVRTPKFLAESAAGRAISPTWTTKAPGFFANVGGRVPSQASVTTYLIDGVLYALDEVAPGFELDPLTLETRGEARLGLPDEDAFPKAHARYLAASGDWLFASTRMGPRGMSIDFVRHCRHGRRIATPGVRVPRMSYVHDFGATDRFAVVILQPAFLRALRYLSGWSTFTDSLAWRPDEGNQVLVIDLASGAARRFEAPSSWVWHVANGYERGDELVVDFVGYADPGHFLGHDAQLAAVMRGEDGVRGAPGQLRRYVINQRAGTLTESILSARNHEFPSIDPRAGGLPHGRIYTTHGRVAGILHSGIAALDPRTGELDTFDFGLHVNALEPVFAAARRGKPDEGWLITQTLDTRRGTSGFAILDARRIADGPVATIDLGETAPISFHGQWVAR